MLRAVYWWNSLRKSAFTKASFIKGRAGSERAQCCSQRPPFFVRVWDDASDLTFQRMTKGSHGDEAGTSIELLTCVHAEAHGVLCLQQWRCFPLTSFCQRNSHSKMFKDIYMVFLMSKHQRTPTRQGILILFFKKEKRRGELFASMQTSMIK